MRLIDADELKSCYTGSNGLDDKASYESIRKMIDLQPTAYDKEQVEQQLENLKDTIGYSTGSKTLLKRVIEIVNAGGINRAIIEKRKRVNKSNE